MQFIDILIIIFLGFLAKKSGLVKEKDGEGLSRIVFNFTLPAMAIETFSAIKPDASLIYLAAASLALGLLSGLAGLFVFRGEPAGMKGMLLMPLLGVNIGLFAFPLVEAIWGKDIIKYFGVFDMGNSIIIFVLCYVVGAVFASGKDSGKGTVDVRDILRKVSRSVPLIVYILTMILRLLNLNYPKIILDVAGIIAKANMPLSLLVLGIFLSFSFEKRHVKKIAAVIGLKYAMGAAIGCILYFTVQVEPYYRYTLLVGAVLPTSLSIIPYAVEFGYDPKFVGAVSNLSILISIGVMWGLSLVLK